MKKKHNVGTVPTSNRKNIINRQNWYSYYTYA